MPQQSDKWTKKWADLANREELARKEMGRLVEQERERCRKEGEASTRRLKGVLGEEGYRKWVEDLERDQEEQKKQFAAWGASEKVAERERQLALDRIGFQRSDWNQLAWYIAFANKQIETLGAGDKLNLVIETDVMCVSVCPCV